jgi:protease-4
MKSVWRGARRGARGAAALLVCGLASACVLNTGDVSLLPFSRPQALREEVIYGKDNDGPKLALIEVQGVITEEAEDGAGGVLGQSRVNMVARIREALELAREDEEVRGVLLRIYSPGGTVTASETIYHELMRWKQTNGRPVLAYLQGLAASGGYYAAMAADEIVAHPASVTGSIGVIMAGINVAGLMERYGVADQTLTSGPFKDSGSPLRLMRPEEREYLQAVVGELYRGFRDVVQAGRPKLPPERLAQLADGRVFTASQALEQGLIDSVGHFEEAVAALEKRAGIEKARVVIYQRPEAYRDNAYSRLPVLPQRLEIDWFGLHRLLPPAGFYYIWPPALPELARP